jgi:3-hydroxybutyryl-CoA dehydrogenase
MTASSGEPIDPIGVVGCGLMGSGIAEVCARADHDVVVVEADASAAITGRTAIEMSLERAVRAARLRDEDREHALARLTVTDDIGALAGCHVVVEAVVENEADKVAVFHALDSVLEDPAALLASNTSSIPIMKLAMATSRPESVLGLHFFNPVPVMRLVELVSSLLTSPDTLARAEGLARSLGKHVIHSQDRAGFVVNALLVPYLLSAIRMLESGFATAEDIDSGMVEGCRHPMGPLRLCDLIGLDTIVAVAESLYCEFKEPLFAPPPMLLRMVDAGLLGRKSGRGFWDYESS